MACEVMGVVLGGVVAIMLVCWGLWMFVLWLFFGL